MIRTAVQTALRSVYPPRCLLCGDLVAQDFGLCGECWRDTPIVSGLVCDLCGTQLPGQEQESGVHCDQCLKIARPWARGRSALLYKENGRRLVLALKHGDRHDVVRLVKNWMIRAASPLIDEKTLIAPVPLHWTRLMKRRYNQSALLAEDVARHFGTKYCPDLLMRSKRTKVLDGLDHNARFQAVDGAITLHPTHASKAIERNVLLVDDVMTSGATLSVCAQACLAAGANEIFVLVLARVALEP